MREIKIDASEWKSINDFYRVLLPALGAPKGHSYGIDPIIDSIIGGGMNAVEPPLKIIVFNTNNLSPLILEHLALAKKLLADVRAEVLSDLGNDVDASIEIRD